jgi:serine/threonine protein kinase
LVFEFVDLFSIMNRNNRTIERYVDQLVATVGRMHAADDYHLDIKAANILLSDKKNTNYLKLVDFGHSMMVRDMDNIYANLCSLNNRPPELLGAQIKQGDEHAFMPVEKSTTLHVMAIDLWALGCVIAEMLLGRPLFEGSTREEVYDSIMRIMDVNGCRVLLTIPKIRDAPAKVRDVLLRLLHLEPIHRTLFSSTSFRNCTSRTSMDAVSSPCTQKEWLTSFLLRTRR